MTMTFISLCFGVGGLKVVDSRYARKAQQEDEDVHGVCHARVRHLFARLSQWRIAGNMDGICYRVGVRILLHVSKFCIGGQTSPLDLSPMYVSLCGGSCRCTRVQCNFVVPQPHGDGAVVLRGSLRNPFFLLRTALNQRPQGPPTANHQPPSAANRHQPLTANRHQPWLNI